MRRAQCKGNVWGTGERSSPDLSGSFIFADYLVGVFFAPSLTLVGSYHRKDRLLSLRSDKYRLDVSRR